MNRREAKTGQSTDAVKECLLNPLLVECILGIPELESEFSLIDIGSGDATFSIGLEMALIGIGRRLRNLALVDADVEIFPDLIGTITPEPIGRFDTQVLQAGKRDVVAEFLEHYEEKYDLALAQLVLQQIQSDPEASYLEYLAYRTLKPVGDLLVVNLHPAYLKYLAERERDKFEIKAEFKEGLIGTYHFDSSGSVEINNRNPEIVLAMLLSLGFDFVKMVSVPVDSIANQKPRYRRLAQSDIPMFYLMHLKKNPTNFISGTEGVVESIKSHNAAWVSVIFADNEEVKIPRFTSWEKVKPGSHLLLHEIRRPEIVATLLNYWVVDPDENVIGGQLLATR